MKAAFTYRPPSLASYRAEWLRSDVVAGLVVSALLIPQGMAYAQLAGLPPITGLYTSMLCLLGYAVVGPSKILVLGPDSSLGPMIAATVLPLVAAGDDAARAIALASLLALLVGTIMIVAGLAHLGFIADLISKPTILGYMNGLAITIIVGQLPKLCGFSISADGFIEEVRELVKGLADGKVVGAALVIGVLGLALILALHRLWPKAPAVLITVVVSAVAAGALSLDAHGVSLVGVLPQGLPPLTIPEVRVRDLGILLGGAFGIALVSLADTISTASSFASRHDEEIDGQREMIGIGAANVAAGLFQGFPVSTSGSRTAVAEQSGSRSQLTGVVGAIVIALVLLFFPGVLKWLPQPTLAAIVIAAALSLIDIPSTMRLYRVRRTECWLSLVALLGVVLLGVLEGIALAVALSIGNVFRRAWWPYQTVLGRAPGVRGYHDVRSYPDALELPGCVIFRFDAPLFFANARTFREQIRLFTRGDDPPAWIIVASEPITDVDTTAADMLRDLADEMHDAGVHVVFAEMKDPVRAKLDRYELGRVIDPNRFFPTIHAAVDEYERTTGVTWRPPSA